MSNVLVGFVPTAGQLCLWLLFLAILHLPWSRCWRLLCRHEKCRANGRPVGDGHSGRRREITEKGDFVFLSPLVGIYAEQRSRMGVEIASQSSGWGVPSLRTARAIAQAVFNKYRLFFYRRLKNDLQETFRHAPSS
jgi:hypothetical protein